VAGGRPAEHARSAALPRGVAQRGDFRPRNPA
jgi:hypothetical protein